MARAGVTLREIDLSTKGSPGEIQPSGTPAGVIGTAKKGPAYVPHVFANMQQFSDTFGSVTERGLDSNGHRFGPLAVNEWMQNSQAGAFVRLLGVGSGKKQGAGGRVSDAGFVVGDQQVQDSGKVGRSSSVKAPAGTFADSGGGRAYMLGCYMSESNGSNYLSEAGLQKTLTPQAATAEITLLADNIVNLNELFITIKSISNDRQISYKLLNQDPADHGAEINFQADGFFNIRIGDLADAGVPQKENILNRIEAAINNAQGNNQGIADDHVVVTVSADDVNSIYKLELAQVGTGLEGNVFIAHSGAETVWTISGFSGGVGTHTAVPIIRGMLFAANGVYPGIQAQSNNVTKVGGLDFNDADLATTTTSATAANGKFASDGDIGYNFGAVSTNQDFEIYLNGLNSSEYSSLIKCSFDPNKTNYFAKVLNTDPTKIDEAGHYLYAHWDITGSAVPSNYGLSLYAGNNDRMIGFLLSGSAGRTDATEHVPDYETFANRYQTAKSPWVISQSSNNDTSSRTTLPDNEVVNLFKLHALDDGEIGHKQFRVLVENIIAAENSDSYGQFDIVLESLESDPVKGDKLAVFRNLTFDPESRNYIARVIGDRYMYYDFDRDESSQRLEERGQFRVRNPYVRVELDEALARHDGSVPKNVIPAGFRGLGHIYTKGTKDNPIFTDSLGFWNGAKHYLSASIPPVPMVRSLGRFVDGETTEPDQIPWGVKFAVRQVADSSLKEATEVTINRSLHSYLKFYSPSAANADEKAMYVEEDDKFCNNMFSLEKICLKSLATNGRVNNWGDALYKRDGIKETGYNRFLRMDLDAKTYNMKYMRFRFPMQGGFDGFNIFDKEKSQLTNAAAIRENNNEASLNPAVFTGPTIVAYQKGIDVFSDTSATEIQLLVTPGISAAKVTDYGISACENRFDAMYIMDIDRYNADSVISGSANTFENRVNVAKTVEKFEERGLDTSFAAAYFPNVIMRRPIDNAPVKVPASVGVLGVYAQNDSIADPWFAPAGLERGQIQRAIGSDVYLRTDELDDIYDIDINPIYVPAGRTEETYIFGQKTLLQDPSALDRVNVRRLLISLRRQVKRVAEQLLFEPNRESTLARFSSLVEPIMQRVQQRRGVVRYKVQIDTSTTTQIDVENNTLRGRIFLQPTKSVEFVSLDFVVTNTISD